MLTDPFFVFGLDAACLGGTGGGLLPGGFLNLSTRLLAGPFTDRAGSLIIIEADSLEEATEFAQSDPYTIHGIFERTVVHPFHQVLPEIPSS